MAYQLLEIVDGDLRACYEYGVHEELSIKTPSWISIYKGDAYVSLSLDCLRAVIEKDWESLAELGLHGSVLVEANGPNMPHGELLVRNGEAVWKTQPTQQSERHQLLLTLAEQELLGDVELVLRSFAHVVSLGAIRVGSGDGTVQRKHSLTATQIFRFSGGLHSCEFTAGGEFILEPFRTVVTVWDRDGRIVEEEEPGKTRLRLTHIDVATLLAFNKEQVGKGVVPREGLRFRLTEDCGVGVWPSQGDFPNDDACALVPFTPREWHWLCASFGFYQAAVFYLKERGRRSAARPRPAALSTPAAEADA